MIASRKLTPAEKKAILKIRRNPRLWIENCGLILTKEGIEETPALNEFQREVNRIYIWCRENGKPCRIIILKPRQKGSSTISLALAYTHLRNHVAYGAVLGDNLKRTEILMEYWDRYALNDRFGHWGNTIERDLRTFSHGSKLYQETANQPRSGTGGTLHFLLASEAAHYRRKGHASGEAVMTGIANSVPKLPNTVIIIESTPNGANGMFYETYQGGVTFEQYQSGEMGNGYIRVFAPWFAFADSEVPLSEDQKRRVMESLDCDARFPGEQELVQKHGVRPEQIEYRRQTILGPECNGDYRKFDQEYPKDDMTCFLQSGSGWFDQEGVAALDSDLLVHPPAWRYGVLVKPEGAEYPVFRETAIAEAWLRINENPTPGYRYAAAADFMKGKQASAARRETDCHAAGVGRAAVTDADGAHHKARVVAALLPDDRLKDIDILAERLALMAIYYGTCPLAPEINVHGDAIVSLLRQHGANVWNRKKQGQGGKTISIPGFDMNDATKRQVLGELGAMVREQEIDAPCKRMVDELRNFISWPDGTLAAGDGWHDDWVIFLAILAHILPAAKTFETQEQRMERDIRRMQHYARVQPQDVGLLAEST